jgi:hypothetical protein
MLAYPIQHSGASSPSRLPPASGFGAGRPPSGTHFPPVPVDTAGRAHTRYSWSPPSTPGDPGSSTPPPIGGRSSQPWSPAGPALHEANPTGTPEHASYYPQNTPQPQEHLASASPNMGHHQREHYYPHAYARTSPGAPGWSPRTPTSPDIHHTGRRISSAQPLGSLTQNQTQQQHQQQASYNSQYMDGHRRGDYDGPAARGA